MRDNPKLAGEFLSLPSDSGKYIFFIEDEKGLRILITGWGFSNSRKQVITPLNKKKNIIPVSTIKIGFAIDSEIQPYHDFSLVTLSGQQKKCQTDSEGFYDLGEQKLGVSINISDADSGKDFSFISEKGKEKYLFDITRYSNVSISVTNNGENESGTPVSLSYHGKEFSSTTDEKGRCVFSLPFFKNEIIRISCKDRSNDIVITFPDTEVEFDFISPSVIPPVIPPVPDEKIIVSPPEVRKTEVTIVCKTSTDRPLPNYPLTISIDNSQDHVITDFKGVKTISDLSVGTSIEVRDSFGDNQPIYHKILPKDNIIEYIIPEQKKEVFNTIQIIRKNNIPASNQILALKQGQNSLVLTLDENGTASYNAEKFKDNEEIIAQILSKNEETERIPFTTDPDERIYLIQEVEIVKDYKWKKIINCILSALLLLALAWGGIIFISSI
ncbi:MAG: hypothetical protein K2J48_03655 [Muribaculaceae bacterium]|nr:hypothetical protein [Muribaculaceae bacterium]